jgi:16S rRNA (cytidine1402-2'-O)-methyltransferase
MGDFSFRAVDVLKSVALVLAEDTRHSRTLLDRYGIETRMASHHEHNEAKTTPGIIARLEKGEDVALISDAGTPLVSDPGQRLVNAAIAAGVEVIPIPGASAMLAALVASGLNAERFTFYGFLPRKGKERDAVIDEIVSSRITAVLYEAANRVADSLQDLAERSEAQGGGEEGGGGGSRQAVVARELTKQFEEIRRGTLESLSAYYKEAPPKGEVVIVIAGAPPSAPDGAMLLNEARAMLARGSSVRDVAAALAKMGAPRNMAYRIAQDAEVGSGL